MADTLGRVEDKEHFARNIYNPRNVDDSGVLKPYFISLRTFQDGTQECGVSGQIYERAGEDNIVENGISFIRKKNGVPTERYIGYALANVGEIRSKANNADRIDVVLTESDIKAHAEIQFFVEGELLRGKSRNSHYLKYCDNLKELFSKDVRKINRESHTE